MKTLTTQGAFLGIEFIEQVHEHLLFFRSRATNIPPGFMSSSALSCFSDKDPL
jgi:hypothetical protein